MLVGSRVGSSRWVQWGIAAGMTVLLVGAGGDGPAGGGCLVETELGWASHVGPWSPQDRWSYPWQAVLEARKGGSAQRGSITEETRIDDPIRLVALHRIMWEPRWLGRTVTIQHEETELAETALVLDALAGDLADDAALGKEAGVSYAGVIADLTPELFALLDGTDWPKRGRIPVRITYIECY